MEFQEYVQRDYLLKNSQTLRFVPRLANKKSRKKGLIRVYWQTPGFT